MNASTSVSWPAPEAEKPFTAWRIRLHGGDVDIPNPERFEIGEVMYEDDRLRIVKTADARCSIQAKPRKVEHQGPNRHERRKAARLKR